MKPSSKTSVAVPESFEAALRELEAIVQTLESGDSPLEASLKAYERGTTLLRYCQDTLGQAEQKIRILDNGSLRNFETDPDTEGRPA
jgi:exodeoxyribonuclease VII small subunit